MFIRFLRNYSLNASKMFRTGEVVNVDAQYGARFIGEGAAVAVRDDIHPFGNAPIVLAQTSIPTIVPPNGTMGANGALSALAVNLQAYTFPQPAWLYFPAGRVYSGSPAGLYYTVLASATTGTVYDVMYSVDELSPINTPKPVVDAGPGAYSQTTGANITVFSCNIPGGLMGANGKLAAELVLGNTQTVNAKTWQAKYGTAIVVSTSSLTNNAQGRVAAMIQNRLANSQIVGTQNAPAYSTGVNLFTSVDTNVDQAFTVSIAPAVADAGAYFFSMDAISLVFYPGV